MQLESLELESKVRDYIRELEARYERRIIEIQSKYEININELKNQYLEIKERYDLLVYKRFVRSAEELIDKSQQLLFNNEGEQFKPSLKAMPVEVEEVKSYNRKKRGRKAIDPNIPRTEKIIDIPESEKSCACGADLTRIGEETSEKLHISVLKCPAI